MAITAADIQNVSFSIDRKGYDVDEVDVFLEHVADEIAEMSNLIARLEEELEAAEAAADDVVVEDVDVDVEEVEDEAPAADDEKQDEQVTKLQAKVKELEKQLAEKAANDNAIAQALIVAQRSADEVVSNARAEASNIIKDADEEADRIIGKAEADRLKIAEAIRSLETDRDDVRAEYREMLANFMGDAQKKLAEIDGDSRRAAVTSQARAEANTAGYAPVSGGAYIRESAPTLAASQPAAAAAPAPAPAANGFIDKDFSGYGAADDGFEFDVD